MSLIDRLEQLRKAPLSVRERFVGIMAIVVMGVAAFAWFIFFSWTITHTDFSLPPLQVQSENEEEILPPYDE